MKVAILFHDNCFDGLASAALFHAFAKTHIDPQLEPVFGGLVHGQPREIGDRPMDTGPLGPGRLVGDLNAIVDFRYIVDDRLHWWFDHHRSAFESDEAKSHFEADETGKKYYDSSAPSCTGFLSRVLVRDYGFDTSSFPELIHWAEIIDSARFPDPKTAVELNEPALRLMTWIESSTIFKERETIIPLMLQKPLSELTRLPFVSSGLEPILEGHWQNVEAMRSRHRREGDVVWCDLTDRVVDAINKFIPYYLHPDARYAVVVTRATGRSKVSIGYSPWAPPAAREHDISVLCERYGGGGHSVVGAISLPAEESDRAVEIGRELVLALNEDASTRVR